jgi:hypothetical protein
VIAEIAVIARDRKNRKLYRGFARIRGKPHGCAPRPGQGGQAGQARESKTLTLIELIPLNQEPALTAFFQLLESLLKGGSPVA